MIDLTLHGDRYSADIIRQILYSIYPQPVPKEDTMTEELEVAPPPDLPATWGKPGIPKATDPEGGIAATTDPPAPRGIPKGWADPTDRQPKAGDRVLVLHTDGSPDFAVYGPATVTGRAIYRAFAFHVAGNQVAVRAWRRIPSNWS